MGINYRQANLADIEQLTLLLHDLFSIEEDFTSNPILQRQGLELLIASPTAIIFIAHRDKDIVGMITGQILISTAEGSHCLTVEDLIVSGSHRYQGIGQKLLHLIEGWGRDLGAYRMQLLADKDNSKGLLFYTKNRWRRTNLICLRKYCRE